MNKTIYLILAISMVPTILHAQTETSVPGQTGGAVVIGLFSLIIILFFSILVLGNILRQVGFVYRDKIREERKNNDAGTKPLSILLILLFAANHLFAQTTESSTASTTISGIPAFDFYLLMGVITLELMVIFALSFQLRKIVKLISNEPEKIHKKLPKFQILFWERFNNAVAIEKEEDILLDHDYDGIKELDNSLPPWWKYGFYLTIVIAVIYFWHYHIGGSGPSSYEEYVMEVQQGEEAKVAYLAKAANLVDESNVQMLDAAGVASGATLFKNACAACHSVDGGGGVGPNLTDDYWLHGGSIKDIFKTIKYGWADKGMKSWKDDFSPKQIAELTSYVKSLKGTTPIAPKDKQGELYIESEVTTDSATTVVSNKQ